GWVPTPSGEPGCVVNVAWPPLRARLLPPGSAVPLSRKVTVPVGVPPPGAFACTVATKLTGWPNPEGFASEPTGVVVASGFTGWLTAGDEVLALKLPSPE